LLKNSRPGLHRYKVRHGIGLNPPLFFLVLFAFPCFGYAVTPPGSLPIPPASASAAQDSSNAPVQPAMLSADDALPDAPQAQSPAPQTSSTSNPAPANTPAAPPQQTRRILYIIPNFRSVTADVKLPPMSTKEEFKLFIEDSFDYSAVAEVAILSGWSEVQKSEPAFHSGFPGYGRYFWHGFADNTDGNLMTEFLVPALTREDPRYYTLGHGGFFHRSAYAVSRLFITRSNSGRATPNFSEIVGNGAGAGISNLYYPRAERNWTKTGQRWFLEVGIDGISNMLKEFWPELNAKFLHNKY